MRITGQVDGLRHRVATIEDDPRVVLTVCGKRMTFGGRRLGFPVRECSECAKRPAVAA